MFEALVTLATVVFAEVALVTAVVGPLRYCHSWVTYALPICGENEKGHKRLLVSTQH